MRLVLSNVRLGRLGLILPALHGLHGVGGSRCGWGVFCGLWDSVEAGGGAAAFINRDAEKAVVELEEHAVRSWETREANALEELESAKRRVLQVAKRISNAQQILGRPDTKPSAVYRIKVGGDLS